MSDVKPIKNREDYDKAVVSLNELIDKNPEANSPEDIQIQILTTLIEDYEHSIIPDYQVDPIEAIKFRIEQLGLKDTDLATYLGSRSRVSEILSGKRPLTVAMIKSLEEGLGIPASILIGSSSEKGAKRWAPSTLRIMASRGYFGKENSDVEPKKIIELGLLRDLFSMPQLTSAALLRQTNYRDISNVDQYHMAAWSNKVIAEALERIQENAIAPFNPDDVTREVLTELFKISVDQNGPANVTKKLETYGIVVVVEPHLPTTKLDGATFFLDTNVVIGLTLRYDRLDNFWFTLAHELAHVSLHNGLDYSAFYDQLFNTTDELSSVETQADDLAGELLIPSEQWRLSPLRYGSTPTLVKMFAKKIGVHESVVAGRIRHDSGDWAVHSEMINGETVRHLFEDKVW